MSSEDNIVVYAFDPTNPPPLTGGQRARVQALAKLKDEGIDFSDIPPLGEDFWKTAVRGKFYRPVKKQVTLRIDSDILHWFKTHKGDARGYQTAINAALRKVVEEAKG